MSMIKVHRTTIKFITWDKVKKIMTAVKRKKNGFCHVEFEVEEVMLTNDLRLHHKCKTNSMYGCAGAPRDTEVLKPGNYFHLTMDYTVK